MAQSTVTFQVEGFRELDEALRQLPAAVQAEVIGPALEEAGEVIRAAAADNIHDRTGKTDADLRVGVELRLEDVGGRATIGGSQDGKRGRAHILRFLEFGAKPHAIPKPGRPKRGQKKGVAFGGKVRRAVKHPGIKAQSPLRRALGESAPQAITAFRRRAWQGIVDAAKRLSRKA